MVSSPLVDECGCISCDTSGKEGLPVTAFGRACKWQSGPTPQCGWLVDLGRIPWRWRPQENRSEPSSRPSMGAAFTCSAIAVTFGGTVFNNDADWRANLRWFTPWKRDEYTDVVQTFSPAFRTEFN